MLSLARLIAMVLLHQGKGDRSTWGILNGFIPRVTAVLPV